MTILNLKELKAQLPHKKRLLGLDQGEKTIGVAVSDPVLGIATPLETLKRRKFTVDAARLAEIIKDYDVGGLVIGLPLNMDGTEGPRCQSVRHFAENLDGYFDGALLIAFQDERLSTAAMEDFLIEEAGLSRQRRKDIIDKLAAAQILQWALDAGDKTP